MADAESCKPRRTSLGRISFLAQNQYGPLDKTKKAQNQKGPIQKGPVQKGPMYKMLIFTCTCVIDGSDDVIL